MQAYNLSVTAQEKVIDVKRKIEQAEGIPVDQQILSYDTQYLLDDHKLYEYGVGEGCTVTLKDTSIPVAEEIKASSAPLSVYHCKQCGKTEANAVLLPCAHTVLCMDCAMTTSRCPICQTKVQSTLKILRG